MLYHQTPYAAMHMHLLLFSKPQTNTLLSMYPLNIPTKEAQPWQMQTLLVEGQRQHAMRSLPNTSTPILN